MSQKELFDTALESVVHELDPDMFGWDFPTMMVELKRAIQKMSPQNAVDSRDASRVFARRCLRMKGEQFQELRGWLKGQPMTADEIRLVLVTLNRIADGTLKVETPPQSAKKNLREVIKDKDTQDQKTSRATRMLVDHTRGMFSSLARLLIESSITSGDVYDGDRMQIKEATRNIFNCLGIDVQFPAEENQGVPISQYELAEIGLKTKKRRKRQ